MAPFAVTTATVRPEHWKDASLVGKVPFRAVQSEQRVSYCVYVPEAHYRLDTALPLPVIVTIHGTGRGAESSRNALIALADREGAVVVAPLFPASVADPDDLQNYKRLQHADIRYDRVLLDILSEVQALWPAVATDAFFLAGFSGGGQFVLRFFYVHPERLAAVSIGAPGLVTHLADTVDWPHGIRGVGTALEGLSVDVAKLAQVPAVQLVVGGNDTEDVLNGFLRHVLKRDYVLPNRKDALAGLLEEFRAAGIRASMDVVPGVAHHAAGVVGKVEEFLGAQIQRWKASRAESATAIH